MLASDEYAVQLDVLGRDVASKMRLLSARNAARAKHELSLVASKYLPRLTATLLKRKDAQWAPIDDEGLRCVFASMSFGDRGMAQAEDTANAFVAHTSVLVLSREEVAASRLIRRAVACGFDPRLGTPVYLNPNPPVDAFAPRIERTMDALFGKARFDWNDPAVSPHDKFMAKVFAHCGFSTRDGDLAPANKPVAETSEESEKLSGFQGGERRWRLTLLRMTGSVGSAENGCAAYHVFRDLWRSCHSAEFPNPAPDLCAELGGSAFEEFLALKRAHIGSLEVDTLKAAAFAKFAARADDPIAASVLSCVAAAAEAASGSEDGAADEHEMRALWHLVLN